MRPILCLTICWVLFFCLMRNVAFGDCPNCDVSYPPMEGSGTVNQLTQINLWISPGWNIDSNGQAISGTNSNIWNAIVGYHDQNVNLTGATELWNNARSGSNGIPYQLGVNQSFFSSTDIHVTRGTPIGGCADIAYDPETGDWTMRLSDGLKNLPHEWIAFIIAHEIGHALGLADSAQDTLCQDTVMNGHHPGGCEPVVKAITAADVDRVREHATNRLTCNVQSQPTVHPIPVVTETGSTDCNDWIDNDGDGLVDCEDGGCNQSCPGGCNQAMFDACSALGAPYCVGGQCYTPILIDVLGDGLQLTNSRNGILFNILPGKLLKIAWTKPNSDDAWLVLDRNENGTVDSGEEMFGNATPQPPPPPAGKNGFLALAVFDQTANGGNGDGMINKQDAVFFELRLWQDFNHNGVSESSELST